MKYKENSTEVIRRNGHIYIKDAYLGVVKKARAIAMEQRDASLTSLDRVFFKDGDWTNFDPDNIVVVRFQERRLRYLPLKAEIWIPKRRTARMRHAARN